MADFLFPHMIPAKFRFDEEGQYHVLKHFTSIDKDCLEKFLRNTQYSRDDLQKRMQKFGSKFQKEFLSNPMEAVELLEKEKDFVQHYRMKSRDRIELQLVYDMARYPEGIGYDTLVRKSATSDLQDIQVRIRHGFPIEYTTGNPRPTWEMHYIFNRIEGVWRLLTVFPGKYAPPFPDHEKQGEEEYALYAAFWKEHVFLVNVTMS